MGCLEDVDRYRRGLRRTSGTSLGMLSLSLVVDDGGVGGKEKPKEQHEITSQNRLMSSYLY